MQGTEKQVKWALEIRQEAIEWAERNVKILENEGLTVDYATELRRLAEKIIFSKSDATYWIENRRTHFADVPAYQDEITEELKKVINPLRSQISTEYCVVWRIRGL